MRLAWARMQRDRGHGAWATPSIHTWDAWLTRQWRDAVQRGAIAPLQLLSAGQERALWEEQLARAAAASDEASALAMHAGALMSSAARATQSRLFLSGIAQSQEERLLADTLAAVRDTCAARGLLSLRLAPAESLEFLAGSPAPLFAGTARLTAQQALLCARFWPGTSSLQPLPNVAPARVTQVRATDPQHELATCAAWCRERLEQDPAARLLVLTAATEPSATIQAQQLWQSIAEGAAMNPGLQQQWLAGEGGDPLPQLGLVADALLALGLVEQAQGVDIAQLLTLLRSPYFEFGTRAACSALAAWFETTGLARMEASALRQALQAAAGDSPAAHRVADWLARLEDSAGHTGRLGTTDWALRFAGALADAGFAPAQQLDAREQQVLMRWHELLDEFAALDAVLAPLHGSEALGRLRRLAGQGRLLPAPADAAIHFSDRLTDPVAHFDGIWVLGVAENRWPAAPRPDAWVPLAEQRRAGWEEASASDRRQQALWALDCWQQRTPELVLSFATRDGDIHHRHSALLAPGGWIDAQPVARTGPVTGGFARETDQQLRAFTTAELASPLAGGAARLDVQQACAFRAQARWRLGAEPGAALGDGIPAWLRGRLLHAMLENLWQGLQDQAGLLATDDAMQSRLLEASWSAAIAATREAAWLPSRVLQRERSRALRLVAQVLELERQRAPFTVRQREHAVRWQAGAARLALRIDRIDEVDGQAVLLDYKSGAPPSIRLQHGDLQPLQLALYADSLAGQGRAVAAAALLNLNPARVSFAGVVAREGLLPGRLHVTGELELLAQTWHEQLQRLMADHLAGDATLARDRQACLHCHLPALCRRAGTDAADDAAAEDADG